MESKGGFVTITLFFFVFFALMVVFILGIGFYGFEIADTLMGDISGLNIGNTSFEETYDETLGLGFQSFLNSLTWMATLLIFGMMFVMMLVGFLIPKGNRMLVVLDIFIIVGAFIVAVYISNAFDSFININEDFLNVYSEDFNTPSTLLLRLPIITTIVGILIMLITYLPFKKKEPVVSEFN